MQKKIVKASPMAMGHLMLEFEDGTKQMVHRGDHEANEGRFGGASQGGSRTWQS